ncbi:MAG: ketose-bisphosphate aldolase [Suipraeoptans sp.]
MELVTMKELLTDAQAGHYAVPAFNVCNLETAQGVMEQAEEMKAPVIFQAHWLEAYYSSPKTLVNMIEELGRGKKVRAAIHLDHGATYEDTVRCVQGGFTSIMYDGSLLPLDENISNLKKVVEMAQSVGVTVEGEIGTIGQNDEMGGKLEKAYLTDPHDAKRLVDETGIDCLAVAIGNAHGFYEMEPKMDFERLKEITDLVKIPLVLHGGTGIPCKQIKEAIRMGIAKVNFSTILRKNYISSMYNFMSRNPEELGLMDIQRVGKESMKEAVKDSILMCMCDSKY